MNSSHTSRRAGRVRVLAGVLLLLAGLGVLPAASFAAAGDWAQLGYGPAHNAYQRDESLLSRSSVQHLTSAFRVHTGYVGGPVAAGGTLFMPLRIDSRTSYFPYLLALNAKTGATLWKSPLDEAALDFSPAVAGGIVYITTPRETELGRAGSLYAFNAQTGAQLWRKEGTALTSPVVADGMVFVAGGESDGPYSLVAYDAVTGDVRWHAPIGMVNDAAAAAVAGGRVIIASTDAVYAFDEQTGALVWQKSVPGEPRLAPTVASGLVLLAGYNGIRAIDAATGAPVWGYPNTGLHFVQGRIAVAGGVAYAHIDNQLVALNLANGEFKWQRTIVPSPTLSYPSSPAVANSVVYISGIVGNHQALLAFGTGGGHLRTIQVQGRDPIISNGRVYLGNFQYVSAFKP